MSLASAAVWNICLPCVSTFTLLLHPTPTSLSQSSTGAETGEVNKQFAQHLCKMWHYLCFSMSRHSGISLVIAWLGHIYAILHACFLNN